MLNPDTLSHIIKNCDYYIVGLAKEHRLEPDISIGINEKRKVRRSNRKSVSSRRNYRRSGLNALLYRRNVCL